MAGSLRQSQGFGHGSVIKVFIIEDQTAVQEMLADVAAGRPGMQVAGRSGDGRAAVQLCLRLRPDFVVLDAMLPGLNGVEVARLIRQELPQIRILIFSGYPSLPLAREALKAGADGFVEKGAALDDLKKALDVVAQGGSYFGPLVARLLREAVANPSGKVNGPGLLTCREREVLRLIAESHRTRAIAGKLSISVKTAENHRNNLMRKLNLHDTAALTRYAFEHGLIAGSRVPQVKASAG